MPRVNSPHIKINNFIYNIFFLKIFINKIEVNYMKKNYALLAAVAIIFGISIFKVTTANESKGTVVSVDGIKSLAYYVANMKEALSTNQECYDKGLDMKTVPNCANALQALQMSHVGGSRVQGYQFSSR